MDVRMDNRDMTSLPSDAIVSRTRLRFTLQLELPAEPLQ